MPYTLFFPGEGNEQQPPINARFEKISSDWFSWTPPCFPVLSLEFHYVDAHINDTHQQILISRTLESVTCPVYVCCTSYCTIIVSGKQQQVFWKWSQVTDGPTSVSEINISEEEDEEDGEEDEGSNGCDNDLTLHSLPFKVMGVAYSAERQKHLENAFQIFREGNVKAKIAPESDNPYDKDAISVMLDYGHEWSKIGYIAKELTKFLHPLLKQGFITNVSLKHINFKTSYLKVGFYATIQITRKGQWENSVLKASKRVM